MVVPSQVVVAPIYLRVRAGQAQNWPRYCGQYNACNRPVYFVQDVYYRDVYTPHYYKHHGKGNNSQGRGHGKGNKGHGKGNKGHGN